MKSPLARALILLAPVCLLALPAALSAQTAQVGTLSGRVRDEAGTPLVDVRVSATSQERGFSRATVTDENGRFLFPSIEIGRYRITAALAAFETTTLTNNLVESEKKTSLFITLRVAGPFAEITVTGDVPIVDKTNTSVNTRLRVKEYEKLPVGRSYQALIATAPGIVGASGNVSAHGALPSNNQFLFDGVDTTDPTTGTFGLNLNFEAIQEVSITTSALSAEYGRAVGAVINVITKSGTNRFSGSAKHIVTNDAWNGRNKTRNEVTGASLARSKFDQINPTYSATLGGPLWRDRAWFFAAFERGESVSPRRQTVGLPEEFQQTLVSDFWSARLDGQPASNHHLWAKYHESPTDGFVVDYWGAKAGEREALTRQDQGGDSVALQWSGVFGSSFTAEALYAENDEFIQVFPFEESDLHNGAPHESLRDGKFYNGATFEGFVKRPRRQASFAATSYVLLGERSHSFKAGFDWQHLESGARFAYPNNQLYVDKSFEPITRTFEPANRRDYDLAVASVSKSDIYSLYLRDKLELGARIFLEIGLRYEAQRGVSDVEQVTVDTDTVSPRFSGSYDLVGTGKTLLLATYGRFHQYILQDLSDAFAKIPQQGNYDNYRWNGREYVFENRVMTGAGALAPNERLRPTYVEEATFGFQHQLGNVLGFGIRGVLRQWHDLIDDVTGFQTDGSTFRRVVNYTPAEREYRGIELTLEKRLSQNWNFLANYTYSLSKGNHFDDVFSSLGDYLGSPCATEVDRSIGAGGRIPCREVQEGHNTRGRGPYDRPHMAKFWSAYTRSIGAANLSLGLAGEWRSGGTFTKMRTLNILHPITGQPAGPTATYFYEERGSDRLAGVYTLDASLELAFRIFRTSELALKGQVFNLTDQQKKVTVNNTLYCGDASAPPDSACALSRSRYGTATVRGAFQAPRSYRLTALVRF